jgi:hypothetical protein
VTPIGRVLPEGWSQVIVGVESTASFAVTVNVTAAPLPDVASLEKEAGTVMVGAVWS